MGVNIHISVDGWDSCANGGMKTILHNEDMFPKLRDYGSATEPGEPVDFRPADFAKWRESIAELGCNVNMWLRAMDAMEADPDLWATYSY